MAITLDTTGIYQRIAASYDERIPGSTRLDDHFSATEINFIERRLSESDEVLDIGCGTGRLTIPLGERVSSIVGLDASSEMLAQAQM